jgi:hypothetical protein
LGEAFGAVHLIPRCVAQPSPGRCSLNWPATVRFPSELEADTLTGPGEGVPMVRLGALPRASAPMTRRR